MAAAGRRGECEAGRGRGAWKAAGAVPLAEACRPRTLDEVVGQEHLTAPGAPLRVMAESGVPYSFLLWGDPGTGKTSIVRILAETLGLEAVELSAVQCGTRQVRNVIEEARAGKRPGLLEAGGGRRVMLFLDEIHRFNKAQQDVLLPAVEEGTLILCGATTENPSFHLTPALRSRLRIFRLEPLGRKALQKIVERGRATLEERLGLQLELDEAALEELVRRCGGDARKLLTLLESAVLSMLPPPAYDPATSPPGEAKDEDAAARADRATEVAASKGAELLKLRLEGGHVAACAAAEGLHYDRSGDEHYSLISAFHKSLRGSDPQAALYWMFRMLESGEDPLYIVRRMVRFASEDVGLADPAALEQALAALEAVTFLGMPEADTAMAQAAVYLATCPKSDSIYKAVKKARACVKRSGSPRVPPHLVNAPTSLMKKTGYGAGYLYPHDYDEHYVPQRYLPEGLEEEHFYEPGRFGYEKDVARRMEYWRRLDARMRHAVAAQGRKTADERKAGGKSPEDMHEEED